MSVNVRINDLHYKGMLELIITLHTKF